MNPSNNPKSSASCQMTGDKYAYLSSRPSFAVDLLPRLNSFPTPRLPTGTQTHSSAPISAFLGSQDRFQRPHKIPTSDSALEIPQRASSPLLPSWAVTPFSYYWLWGGRRLPIAHLNTTNTHCDRRSRQQSHATLTRWTTYHLVAVQISIAQIKLLPLFPTVS